MQPLPRYWATVRRTVSFPQTKEYALTIHGASDVSVQEAQRDAEQRMERLLAAGGPEQLGRSGVE